jgi:hypothetical protein
MSIDVTIALRSMGSPRLHLDSQQSTRRPLARDALASRPIDKRFRLPAGAATRRVRALAQRLDRTPGAGDHGRPLSSHPLYQGGVLSFMRSDYPPDLSPDARLPRDPANPVVRHLAVPLK